MVQNNSLNKTSNNFTVSDIFLAGSTISTLTNNMAINPGANEITSNAAAISQSRSNTNAVFQRSSNTNNASGTADAAMITQVGGSAGGDPYFRSSISSARNYSWGIDNSDSDILKINTNNAGSSTPSSGTNLWNMTSEGENTLPLQPAFLAYRSSNATNVTGDATNYTVVFDAEDFDIGSNFSSTTFTAPVSGIYLLMFNVVINNVTSSHTLCQGYITGSGQVSYGLRGDAANINDGGTIALSGGGIFQMTASDTARVIVQVSGSTKTIAVAGGGLSTGITQFSGYLLG